MTEREKKKKNQTVRNETINISLHFSAARQNSSRLTEVRVSQHAASQILQYHN